ncbi:Down syndrome cell adhesion molecule [Penaeus vannamei]|uniref:Down syndrome cell adhesion molecule n=1 Tax=Penaeus vannamei TaxID=6689 RepID=A0A423U629_PENVA|nr:Down syndrome cell adhesion molecule [Penaeus vannamei]
MNRIPDGLYAVCDESGPVIVEEPDNRVDFSNSTGAKIHCSVRGRPAPSVVWVRADNGSAIGVVPGLRMVLSNGTLIFPPFRAEDYRQEVHAQVYRCQASNSHGTVHSRDVHVRAVVAQHYETEVNNEFVIRGNSAILKCHIPSFVADFVSVQAWVDNDGTAIYPSESYDGKYLVLPSGELHIRSVSSEDGFKSYKCRTVHRLTQETRLSATAGRLVISVCPREPRNLVVDAAHVGVPDPAGSSAPHLTTRSRSQTFDVAAGLPTTVLCEAQASPPPSFR